MIEKNQDYLNLLRKIKSKPESTQRELASELGISLGKLNYCINALKTKGLIKALNDQYSPAPNNSIKFIKKFKNKILLELVI